MDTLLSTPRQEHWLKYKAGTTPASTQVHEDFIKIIEAKKSKILDLGCGNGRISVQLAKMGQNVTGIDINESEIDYAKTTHPGIKFSVGSAEKLKFKASSFDHVVTLGLFGAVEKSTRLKIFKEALRVLKPGGYLYLGEFGRITDPLIKTSKGKRWIDVYSEDLHSTGEFGSVIVHPENEKKSFIAHHFAESDLVELAQSNEISEYTMHRVFTVSRVSGEKRPSWNVWYQKPL